MSPEDKREVKFWGAIVIGFVGTLFLFVFGGIFLNWGSNKIEEMNHNHQIEMKQND